MKKLLTALLALMVVASSFAACSNETAPEETTPAVESTEEATEETAAEEEVAGEEATEEATEETVAE